MVTFYNDLRCARYNRVVQVTKDYDELVVSGILEDESPYSKRI